MTSSSPRREVEQMTPQTIRVKIDLAATGANIRRLRKEKGLSVIKVQMFLGIGDPQTVYQWEWGRNLPCVENLIALSILLETPIEKLLVWSRPPPEATPTLFWVGVTVWCRLPTNSFLRPWYSAAADHKPCNIM